MAARAELESLLTLVQHMLPEDLPRLLGDLEQIRVTALARLTAPMLAPASEELLSITAAASRLGVSKDYLYRHAAEFSFTRRIGRKLLFSSTGIDAYIRQKRN